MTEASPELVTITVDGKELQAPKGAMLIEITDRENIKVPRFCYHKKLSVAANCRMCLVEVEKAPKPLPACATPVMEGMVVHTQSEFSIEAQKSVMEFLLINHPLDCPICDQGGECELQDVAMEYGQDVSEYVEGKRVVFDKSIGPLISTELTRCIHCTRCVRFGIEIAGIQELGMTGRGEFALISTSLEHAVSSEMSGNVIDLCPVGALTAKPSRFAARAWEMIQHVSIAPHDCVGSNIYIHTLRNEVIRIVPRENENINEVWISDRDRFSYEGLNSDDRLKNPMIKVDGEWQQADWSKALQTVADVLKKDRIKESVEDNEASSTENVTKEIASLVSPTSTLEEMYLLQKLTRALGSGNIDHRLRQSDFSDQENDPVMPWLGQAIQSLESIDAALLIGSNVRKEQPLISHRLRKAVLHNNAKISFVNTRKYEFNFTVANNIAVAQQDLVKELSAIAAAAFKKSGVAIPKNITGALSKITPDKKHEEIINQLVAGEKTTVILGNQVTMHPEYSKIRILTDAIALQTSSVFGCLSESCNDAGAWLSGVVPHRGPAGDTNAVTGKTLGDISGENLSAMIVMNLDPEADSANSSALLSMLAECEFVVAITSFSSPALLEHADVFLPAANFTETSGTFVNIEGQWQSFKGVCKPAGEARPGWKILRVLGNLLNIDGFNQNSSEDVKNELRSLCENIELDNSIAATSSLKVNINNKAKALMRSSEVPVYSKDQLVRRAPSLQKTTDAQSLNVRLNSMEAEKNGVLDVDVVMVKQGKQKLQCPLKIDESIPDATAWIPLAVKGNDMLGEAFGSIEIEKIA